MNKCKKCRSLFLEHFYGELDPTKKDFFDSHISDCEKCRSRFAEMEAVLQFTGKRIRPEPPEKFWESFEKKLSQMIETGEAAGLERESPRERPGRRLLAAPKWAYQAAAAATLIIIGVFIGKALFSPQVPGVQRASQRSEFVTHARQEMTLIHRSQDYIDRSKLILLALVNFDPSVEDPYALDLPFQKQVSKELVEEAGFLKKELADSDQERLEKLIFSLEMILLQIANLESENDLDAIELVRDGIIRKGLLMEINLSDLRFSTKKEGRSMTPERPSRKPKTF
jgi:hypothetical protein